MVLRPVAVLGHEDLWLSESQKDSKIFKPVKQNVLGKQRAFSRYAKVQNVFLLK